MTVITPKSVFVHIGRTGGHWVSHVLWRAGLAEARLEPLHMRPKEIRIQPQAADKPFWFAFVRHPLQWLRSIWLHGIEHSWGDPDLANWSRTEDFPTFLERIAEAHPGGPVGNMLGEYIDAAHFIGRTENLAEDLITAMQLAGEDFDPALARLTPPINASKLMRVEQAAKAPKALLENLLQLDSAFASRFGYDFVPPKMIDDNAPRFSVFPQLPIKEITQQALFEELKGAKFDNPIRLEGFPADTIPDGVDLWRRRFWSILAGLESIPPAQRGQLLHVDAGDGYFAHLSKALGYDDVHAFAPVRRLSLEALSRLSGNNVRIEETELLFAEPAVRYETVLMSELLLSSAAPQLTLRAATALLRPGGTLLVRAILLNWQPDVALWVPYPPGIIPFWPERCGALNESGLRELLQSLGYRDITIVDEDMEHIASPTAGLEDLAGKLGVDTQNMFVMVMVKATYQPDIPAGRKEILNAFEDLWWRQRPLYLADPANLAPDGHLKRHLNAIEQELDMRRAEVRDLTGALADRNADLDTERAHAEALKKDLDADRAARLDVLSELDHARLELVDLRSVLEQRTQTLSAEISRDRTRIAQLDSDLKVTRQHLAERTDVLGAELEKTHSVIAALNNDLATDRALLVERTRTLEDTILLNANLRADLDHRQSLLGDPTQSEQLDSELKMTRQHLAERTEGLGAELENAHSVIAALNNDLATDRALLVERTRTLEDTIELNDILRADLDHRQSLLSDRTTRLEACIAAQAALVDAANNAASALDEKVRALSEAQARAAMLQEALENLQQTNQSLTEELAKRWKFPEIFQKKSQK